MARFDRIPARNALDDVSNGQALLVNGYDSEEKWQATAVPGATSFMDFQAQLPNLPKDRELVFYCA